MAKSKLSKDVEQQIAALNVLRDDPDRPEARALLIKALAATRSPLVAAAANILAEAELAGFDQQLTAALEFWFEQPAKSDPGCSAKTSLVRALYKSGARAHALFLRGIKLLQAEGVWGGAQDTAVELRGLCALALVRSGYFDALYEIAELLADPEPMARVAAAQAIAYSERQDVGVPLLRFKARLGDPDARVMAACFSGLLSLAPDSSLAFVERFIEAEPLEMAEAALLALGEARSPDVLPILKRTAESPLPESLRATAFIALAMLRNDAARKYLVQTVREENATQARLALSALAPYCSMESVRSSVLSALQERRDPQLDAHAQRLLANR
jgi:hypothetical protein